MKRYDSRNRCGRCRLAWGVGALAVALYAARCVADEYPFIDTFEAREAGALHAQNGWQSRRQNDVQVQAAVSFDGQQAAVVSTNATVWHDFTDTTATNVWIDFYARVPQATNATPPAIGDAAAAAFFVAPDGSIRAVSNDTWVTLAYTVESNTWYRFTANLDYVNRRWALYVAGSQPNELATTVATNLQFSSTAVNTYFHRFRIRN